MSIIDSFGSFTCSLRIGLSVPIVSYVIPNWYQFLSAEKWDLLGTYKPKRAYGIVSVTFRIAQSKKIISFALTVNTNLCLQDTDSHLRAVL